MRRRTADNRDIREEYLREKFENVVVLLLARAEQGFKCVVMRLDLHESYSVHTRTSTNLCTKTKCQEESQDKLMD